MANYISKWLRILSVKEQTEETAEPLDNKFEIIRTYRSLNDAEAKTFTDQVNVRGKIKDLTKSLPSLLSPLAEDLQKKRIDNDRLIALAPEIDQAASILIPSILSPNDMRTNQFNIVIDSTTEDDATLTEITKLLLTVFADELKLSNKLYHWLYETLFRSGAKPLLILPSNIIAKIEDVATASLETFSDPLSTNLKGSSVTAALEGLDMSFMDEDGKKKQTIAEPKESNINKCFSDMKLLSFTRDIQAMDLSRQRQVAAVEALSDDLSVSMESGFSQFTENQTGHNKIPYLNLDDFIDPDDNSPKYPSIVELPYESTIPIIIEGSPDNHIGYFVILNEQGIPVSASKEDDPNDDNGNPLASDHGSRRIDTLYKSFYGSNYTAHQKKASNELKSQVIEKVYSKYLDESLSGKLKNMNLDGFSISMTSDITKVMFTRLMRNTKTGIIFIPSNMITYLAFEYNPNGTGRSKIDNIKFPLSLKMTLIITRLISLVESSVNRRKLDITLDDTVANPVETLQAIRKEIMKKKLHGISYDPNTIISGVLDKELTVVPSRIPGVENFSITDENNSVDYPRPDDSLLEEINNMYTLSLGVAPNALNKLREDELAISVATNNLYMSNQLRTSQGIVSECMTDLLQTFIRFSSKMQNDIRSLLDDTETADKDKQSPEEVNKRLVAVIKGIKFTLPKPNIAFDKSQFEQLREYMSMIDDILNTLMSDDLVDRDTQDSIKQLRAYAKREMILDHVASNSAFGSDFSFDTLEDVPISEVMAIQQAIDNFKKGGTDLKKVLSGEGDDDSGGSRW